jgi:hypothetical protein
MRKVSIEWKHFDKEGKTCKRCFTTGENLAETIKELQSEFSAQEVEIEFKETKLSEGRMDESNAIFIDDILLEDLLAGAKAGMNSCSSCGDLIGGKDCCCRTISLKEEIFEEIPAELIREAISNRMKST